MQNQRSLLIIPLCFPAFKRLQAFSYSTPAGLSPVGWFAFLCAPALRQVRSASPGVA